MRGPARWISGCTRADSSGAGSGERLGGDFALGDRIWRRILHGLGAVVLVYFVVPNGFFVFAPKEVILLVLLGLVVVAELLRFTVGLELPTVRDYESHRVGGYVYFAVALTIVVLLFPEPIAVAVVLGTAFVDPVAGELRTAGRSRSLYPAVPVALYAVLAFTSLAIDRPVALGAGRASRARGGCAGRRGRAPEAPLGGRRLRDDDRARAVPLRGRGARPGTAAVAAPAQTIGVRTACGAPFEESTLIA